MRDLLSNIRIDRLEKRVGSLEKAIEDIQLLVIQNNKSLQDLLDAVALEQRKVAS